MNGDGTVMHVDIPMEHICLGNRSQRANKSCFRGTAPQCVETFSIFVSSSYGDDIFLMKV